jgi:hypothetical protein
MGSSLKDMTQSADCGLDVLSKHLSDGPSELFLQEGTPTCGLGTSTLWVLYPQHRLNRIVSGPVAFEVSEDGGKSRQSLVVIMGRWMRQDVFERRYGNRSVTAKSAYDVGYDTFISRINAGAPQWFDTFQGGIVTEAADPERNIVRVAGFKQRDGFRDGEHRSERSQFSTNAFTELFWFPAIPCDSRHDWNGAKFLQKNQKTEGAGSIRCTS